MREAQRLAVSISRIDTLAEYKRREILLAAAELRRLDAENEMLKSHLQFVERWANHHATKPHVTAGQALSVIQHFPAIKSITHGYADGKVPDTHDPYAELRRLDAIESKWAALSQDDGKAQREIERLMAVNAQLLEALKAIVDVDFFPGAWTANYEILAQQARAAIQATGETK